MLAKLFNNISLGSLVRAVAFSLLASGLAVFFFGQTGSVELHIAHWQLEIHPLLYRIVFVLVILSCSAWFNSGINSIGFLKKDYQLIPVLSLLLTPVLINILSFGLLIEILLGQLLILRLFSLSVNPNYSYVLFDVGTIIGLMMLLYPASAVFIILAWLAVLSFGSLFFRALLMPVVGIMAVWFLIFALLLGFSGPETVEAVALSVVEFDIGFNTAWMKSWWQSLPLLIVLLPALLEMMQMFGKANVLKRQAFTFLILFFLLFLLGGAFLNEYISLWVWVNWPLAVFLINLIHYLRKAWMKDLVYVFLILYLALFLLV